MAPAEPRIWLIAGPTASGKSALALRLAKACGGEIVNADSMQIYRDLAVLTARPSPEDQARAPHHLFGVADGAEAWSVGRWLAAATQALADIAARGRAAIVVGGTGLYFRALTGGLSAIPAIPAEVRDKARSEFAAIGEAAYRSRLADVDPASAARVASGDRQRLIRAWEVAAATGAAIGSFQEAAAGVLGPGMWRGVVLDPPRPDLHARCDARLQGMLDAGALDEVGALLARDLRPDRPVMKALGVREFAEHLAGTTSLGAALGRARTTTRRYVKRQATWFRHQTPAWPRVTAPDPGEQWRQFIAIVAESGLVEPDHHRDRSPPPLGEGDPEGVEGALPRGRRSGRASIVTARENAPRHFPQQGKR